MLGIVNIATTYRHLNGARTLWARLATHSRSMSRSTVLFNRALYPNSQSLRVTRATSNYNVSLRFVETSTQPAEDVEAHNEDSEVVPERSDRSQRIRNKISLTALAQTSNLPIPEPPVPPPLEAVPSVIDSKITGAMLPFSHLSWFQTLLLPVGYPLMYGLDSLHTVLPWWGAIAALTVGFRIMLIPLVIKSTSVTTRWMNIMPKEQDLRARSMEARYSANEYEAAKYDMKLKALHKEHDVRTFQRLWPIMAQSPIFLSFIFLLRSMSEAPVESLQTGGIFWFKDLTIPDPYCLLPIITCSTLLVSLELGSEGSGGTKTQTPTIKWVIRCIPLVVFPFIYNFPSAILVYWCTNNFFTLFQGIAMKNRKLRDKLGIPQLIKHDPSKLPLSNMSVLQSLKNSRDQARAIKSTSEARRLDEIQFRKAGVGPLRKTYKDDPTLGGKILD